MSAIKSRDDLLTRRSALSRLSLVLGSILVPIGWKAGVYGGAVSPSCVLTPQQTEGPYFVDERLQRSDIRSDPADGSRRPGMPLTLRLSVREVAGNRCAPLAGALVDVWHCDAQGIYSDVQDPGFNTKGEKFLRGYQLTDEQGLVQFTTIYPGWYRGRAVHIHFKVRRPRSSSEVTSQLYFDDAITDQVHRRAPYNSKGQRDVRNRDDAIFRRNGSQLIAALKPHGEGYDASFEIGVSTR